MMVAAIVTAVMGSCDKAPGGVIKEGDMAHVIADFAKAEGLIAQYPDKFPDDSSKLALKQSILKKYDADLEKYDSSLVWYAHNLKIYAEVHDKAVEILEKEGHIYNKDRGRDQWAGGSSGVQPTVVGQQVGERRVYSSSGDSADVWKEPRQWVLTSGMRKGYITFDYAPDAESRQGDLYSLNLKMLYPSGDAIKLMLAIDYIDGTTSYLNRTANVFGWSNFNIQADTTRSVKRIYGFIAYDIKPHQVAMLDSIYLLRTHLDMSKYDMISFQRIAGPKSVLEKEKEKEEVEVVETQQVEQGSAAQSFPGRPGSQMAPVERPVQPQNGAFKPKPGLNKSVVPSRNRGVINPNGPHVARPPIN